MSTEYPDESEIYECAEYAPAVYQLLDNGTIIFTEYGEYCYRSRLERLGIGLKSINTLKRLERVNKLLDFTKIEESKHKVVRTREFLTRRSAQASDRLDRETVSRLAQLMATFQ
jgi:hypothetical protein